MSKNDYLKKQYEELNKLKNLLNIYPKEYTENIIISIKRVCDEITSFLESKEKKNRKRRKAGKKHRQADEKVFTLEELAQYNGENGQPSYVAVDGVVYDVSSIFEWKNGNHFGLFAGQDLSSYFSGCHSENIDILKNAKKVGVLQVRQTESLPKYTLQELSNFDGQNGRSAYVAINGNIYDVTSIKSWYGGKHYGVMAGKDLMEQFNVAHKNEKDIFNKLKIVGTIVV